MPNQSKKERNAALRNLNMIQGSKIKKVVTHSDSRGYFREILRDDDKLLQHFGQASVSLTNPGVIKAFHWHNHQDDVFYVVRGKAQVVLYDIRRNSNTYKQLYTIMMSENNQKLLFIPRKVAHGYKALGKNPLLMLYIMNNPYNKNKPDEERIPHDDKQIGFNWARYK